MKKYLVLISGVAIQLILGSIYAWSAIAELLSDSVGLSAAQAQSIYGTAIGVFAAGTIFFGRMLRRIGPRISTAISALLFGSSYLIAGISGGSYPILLVSLGLLLGLGIAAGYVVPLSTATAHFPNIKGTVTGLAVMGFGGGAILASWLVRSLDASGVSVLDMFPLFAGIGAAVLLLASSVQEYPQAMKLQIQTGTRPAPIPVGQLMRDGSFWSLYATMFTATLGGLIIIGSVVSLGNELGFAAVSAIGISVLALGNSSGRLIWGSMMDRIGIRAIPVSLVLMLLGFVLILFSNGIPLLFFTGVFLTGFQFGASLVLYGSFCEHHFGDGAISTVYPMIFTAYGLAALIGPVLGGVLYDAAGSYNQLLIYISILPLVALGSFALGFIPRNQTVQAGD